MALHLEIFKKRHSLNLTPSRKDARDHVVRFGQTTEQGLGVSLPPSVNLAATCPPVFDQGSIGSCTANAAGTMYSQVLNQMTRSVLIPSRLYIYWNTRSLEGTTSRDVGATLRGTMRSLARFGVCRENTWIYQRSNLFRRPNSGCYTEGSDRQALSYAAVPTDLFQMKSILNSGYPFVFGMLLFSSFMRGSTTGNIPIPNPSTESYLGGHAMCAIGYDDAREVFIVRNSWGRWGDNGNLYIPYSYMTDTNLCFDMWVLYTLEIPSSRSHPVRIHDPRRTT